MSEFTTHFTARSSDLFDQVASVNEVAHLPAFSFAQAHQELQQLVVEADAVVDHWRVYDHDVASERVKELEFECYFIGKECLLDAVFHLMGPLDDYLPPEEMQLTSGKIIGTPQCFTFIQNPLTSLTEPYLISLSQIFAHESAEPEVVELFTPLQSLKLTLHTPSFN